MSISTIITTLENSIDELKKSRGQSLSKIPGYTEYEDFYIHHLESALTHLLTYRDGPSI